MHRSALPLSSMSSESNLPSGQSRNPSDYEFTDAELFYRYVTDTCKLLPRRITGLSAKHQRRLTKAVKQARNMLLLK